jgi:roadblock/LC7 domain-containing protein
MDSILAMTDFVEALSLEGGSLEHGDFRILVEYKSSLRNVTEITTATFIRNGYNDGEIKLAENGELNSDNYHMDFTPSYQVYAFNSEECALIITGSSGKMGGNYKVKLKKI